MSQSYPNFVKVKYSKLQLQESLQFFKFKNINKPRFVKKWLQIAIELNTIRFYHQNFFRHFDILLHVCVKDVCCITYMQTKILKLPTAYWFLFYDQNDLYTFLTITTQITEVNEIIIFLSYSLMCCFFLFFLTNNNCFSTHIFKLNHQTWKKCST